MAFIDVNKKYNPGEKDLKGHFF